MRNVDLEYVDGKSGCNLFFTSFQPILLPTLCNPTKENESVWLPLVPQIEKRFFYLIAECKKRIDDKSLDKILETPTLMGATCFTAASMFSEKIMNFILQRQISMNAIKLNNDVVWFKFPQHTVDLLKRDVNPKIIRYDGQSSLDRFKASFKNDEAMTILKKFSNSIHFTTADINCEDFGCEMSNCPSRYKRFYYKDGPLVERTADNKIGSGGFGDVYEGPFHGKNVAMKFTRVEIIFKPIIVDAVSELEKNISEYRTQLETPGSGVLLPTAFFRQQNQKQDGNGKCVAENYNIFIYPLYDCNLYELHTEHFDKFTEEVLGDIFHQCFNRKDFEKFYASIYLFHQFSI